MRLDYIPELDGLRALACLLVIFFHAAPGGPLPGGFLGVDLFFVLSGYLITGLLLTEWRRRGRIAVARFYLNRALRLAPALLFFLTVYLAIAPAIWPHKPHLRDAFLTAFYLSDYSYPLAGSPQYLRHSWSLAVEEQFYLIWPIVIAVIARPRTGILLLAAGWMAVSAGRYMLAPGDWTDYYYPLHTHSSGLIAGAGLALAQREGWLNIRPVLGRLALLAFLLLASIANIAASAVTITIAELLSLVIIGSVICGASAGVSRLLSARPLVGLGKLSYGLYLWHFPIALYFRQDHGFVPSAAATLGLSLIGALISYYTVEAWGRAARRRVSLMATASSGSTQTSAALR